MQGGKELKTISLLISPGQYTLGLRVTDNDSLTSTTTCTIYAVQLEVDVPTSYPQWVNVDDTLNVGCTVTNDTRERVQGKGRRGK